MNPPTSANQELRSQTTRGVVWVFGSTGTMMVLRVVLFACLARLLRPADFGLFAAATSILGILEVVALLGVSPALIQRKDLNARHISSACVLAGLFGAASAGAVWLTAGWIGHVMRIADLAEVLRTVAPIFFIRSCSMVGYGLAAREMRFSLTAFAEIVSFLVYGVTAVAMAFAGFGAWSLILGYVIQQGVLSLLVILPFSGALSLGIHRKEMGELLAFCSGISAANMATYIATQGDNYVVGRVLGVENLGYYSRAYNLMQTFATSVVNTLDQVFFPSLSKVQGDSASLAKALRLSVALVWYGYLPLSGVLVVCAPEVVTVLLGARWLPMVPAFRILVCGLVFRAGFKMGGTVLKVRGKASVLAATQVAYAAMVVGGAAWGSRSGIEGVAAGVWAALAVNYVLVNWLGFRLVGQRWLPLLRDLAGALILTGAVVAVAAAAAVATARLGWAPGWRLVAAAAALGALGTAGAAFRGASLAGREVREFLGTLWRDLRLRFAPIGRRLAGWTAARPAWGKS